MKFNGLHTFCIRSSYQDPVISRYRLDVLKATLIPSLTRQTDKRFQVYLRIHNNDPLFDERWAAFESVGVPIIRTMELHSPPGMNLQTRIDDDDAISLDFVDVLQRHARNARTPISLNFPQGVLFARGSWRQMQHNANMFISLLTPGDVQIFKEVHGKLGRLAPIRQVQVNRRFWCWVRHEGTVSRESDFRLKQPMVDTASKRRFGHVNFPAVCRASDACRDGKPAFASDKALNEVTSA